MVIYTGSCKSNYHAITTTKASVLQYKLYTNAKYLEIYVPGALWGPEIYFILTFKPSIFIEYLPIAISRNLDDNKYEDCRVLEFIK